MHHRVLILVGVLTGLVAGCNDRHTDRKVVDADVIGTWRLTPQSLALLKRDGYSPAPGETYSITFAADGTLQFASVLPSFQGGTYLTTAGTWTLKHNAAVDNQTMRANALSVIWGRFEQAGFAYENGKLILWTWYGDPDNDEHIDYVRE